MVSASLPCGFRFCCRQSSSLSPAPSCTCCCLTTSSDYQRLPEEDKLLTALRATDMKRGLYIFPFGTHRAEMKSPTLIEKYKQDRRDDDRVS